jgi:hypothetical protein
MYLVKLVLLACPALVASVLLASNPANAANIKSASDTQAFSELTTPHLNQSSNPILDQLNCSCNTCVRTQLELLQGKLPIGNI